jgi:hypothetical protein
MVSLIQWVDPVCLFFWNFFWNMPILFLVIPEIRQILCVKWCAESVCYLFPPCHPRIIFGFVLKIPLSPPFKGETGRCFLRDKPLMVRGRARVGKRTPMG